MHGSLRRGPTCLVGQAHSGRCHLRGIPPWVFEPELPGQGRRIIESGQARPPIIRAAVSPTIRKATLIRLLSDKRGSWIPDVALGDGPWADFPQSTDEACGHGAEPWLLMASSCAVPKSRTKAARARATNPRMGRLIDAAPQTRLAAASANQDSAKSGPKSQAPSETDAIATADRIPPARGSGRRDRRDVAAAFTSAPICTPMVSTRTGGPRMLILTVVISSLMRSRGCAGQIGEASDEH
jgi:hypothetical protein